MTVPLPAQGDTDWMDWATQVQTAITTRLDAVTAAAGRLTSLPARFQAAPYTLASADRGTILFYDQDTTPGTFTLPTGAASGDVYTVAQTWSGPLTVAAEAGSDGIRTPAGTVVSTMALVGMGTAVMLVKDPGTRWLVLPFGTSF